MAYNNYSNNNTQAKSNSNDLKLQKTDAKSLVDSVNSRIESLKEDRGLTFPNGYSPVNALQSAQLILTKPDKKGISIMDDMHNGKISATSVVESLVNMVIQGLNPSKSQGYFIEYGNQLSFQRSYLGSITVLKRLPEIKDISAEAIFQGDDFEIDSDENMNLIVSVYHPKFANRDNQIVGAFANILKADGTHVFTVMTKEELKMAWSQSRMHTNGAREKFAQEFARKTVLNRASKLYINTATNDDTLISAVNQSSNDAFDFDNEPKDVTPNDNPKQVTSVAEILKKSEDAKKNDNQTHSDGNQVRKEQQTDLGIGNGLKEKTDSINPK